jgi:SAM-dependent methyltransferase
MDNNPTSSQNTNVFPAAGPMDPPTLAAQLRQPSGDVGKQVGRAMNKSNLAQNEEALRILAMDNEPRHMLELGMGNGGLVADWLVRYPNLTYTGIDFSATMVEEAVAINVDWIAGGRARFWHGEAHALPVETSSVDYVFTVNTVYFWPDPGAVLAEFHRVLKPKGVLMMALRSEDTMKNLAFTDFGFTRYSLAKLEALMEASPFGPSPIHHFHEDMRTDAAGNTYPADSFLVRAIKN